jgi:hypothetical protein
MSHDHRATLGVGQGTTAWDVREAFRSTPSTASEDVKKARARAYRALTGPHTDAPIEEMMGRAGLVLGHAASPAELDLPVTVHGDTMFLEDEVVRPDLPLFYLADREGNLKAILQYYWHEGVPPPNRCATVTMLYVFDRKKGLGSILAALAIREAARAGKFKVGGFITDVRARNIHYTLSEEDRHPMAEEDFDPDVGIEVNRVRNGQKAEAIARKYLESLLGL